MASRSKSQSLLFALGLILVLFSSANADPEILFQDAGRIVWRIDYPPVRVPRQVIPQIVFRRFDEVIVRAGGCAQTGGAGDTWKRYVNPSGGATDRLYHGKIFIPGATAGLVRVSSITSPYQHQPLHLIINKLPPHYDGSPLYLELGYEDEDYGDNGYWGHDDGNNDQCKYENDGGPAWLEITIIHHSSSLPTPNPIAPMDLWWTSLDDNFFPLNPTWWYQVVNGRVPNANEICGHFQNPGDSLPAGKSDTCTLWDPEVNEVRPPTFLCPSDGVRGHINWAPATYTGRLFFKDYSGGWPHDADYNFTLLRPDFKGVTTPTEFMAEGQEGVGLEFNSNETVDRMDGTGTWWDWLHRTVDNDQDSIKGKFFGEAVVVGLLGLDHAHAAHAELHPVYALAIHIADDADSAVWAVFARNLGNEGSCAQQNEPLFLRNDRISLFIPRPADTTVTNGGSRFYGSNLDQSGYRIDEMDEGVVLARTLGFPWNRGLFWGELHLKKEKADLALTTTAVPDPVVTGSKPNFTQGLTYTITVTNNGPDRAHPVTITDSLPSSTQFVSCTATGGGSCGGAGNSRVIRFPSIAPGSSVAVRIRVFVDCSLDTGELIANTAAVTSATLDPNPANNSFTIQTTALDPPPVFTYVPPDVTACTEPDATTCGTVVDPGLLGMATADDNCPGVTVVRTGVPSNNYYPVGTTVLTYTARDSHNHTTIAEQRVIVKDCTPPVITPLVVDKPVLWPANHQMQWLTVDYVVTDNCPLPPNPCVLSTVSDEPIKGTGPRDFSPDWQIEEAHHLYLRSERAGDDKQRNYTVTATCTDAAGNVSTKDTRVMVPVTAPVIEVEKAQQGNTIDNRLIRNLPNVERDFSAYVFTLPGATDSRIGRFQFPGINFGSSGFSVGGSDGRGNEVTVDSGENQEGNGNIRFVLSPEAVREIQVNRSSYPAEFGFTSAAAVNFVTNSGTNTLHGNGYLYWQPKKTTARNAFNSNSSNTTDWRIVPGFTLAGPIKTGQAYFFTNYEHWLADVGEFRDYVNGPQLQPSASQIALLNRLDASSDANVRRIAANLRVALTTSPATYPTTFKLLTDNSGTFTSKDRFDSWLTRLDYQITDRDWLMGRFSLTRRDSSGIGFFNLNAPSRGSRVEVRDYTTLLSWTHEMKVNFINHARLQFSPHGSQRNLPSNPTSTSLSITDFALFGRALDSPLATTEDRFQVDDDLTWILPKHLASLGGSYRTAKYDVSNGLGFAGDWTFSPGQFSVSQAVPASDQAAFLAAVGTTSTPTLTGIQSFDLGLPSLFRQGFGDPVLKGRSQYVGLFAQDTWKAGSHLTINYGGRLDFAANPSHLPNDTFFSPRTGFAWEPSTDHKTLIRGGVGIFYAPALYRGALLTALIDRSGQHINEILRTSTDGPQSPAALWAAGVALGRLPFGSLTGADLNTLGVRTRSDATGRVLFEVNRDFRNPYSVQVSIGLQRKLNDSASVEATYLLYRDFRLPRVVETNYRESSIANPLGIAFGPYYSRIDPNLAQTNDYQSTGKSSYHGMTLSLTRGFTKHLQFQANYTLSKTIDDQFDGIQSEAAFPTRLGLEKSLSSFNIRHSFVASGVFMIPSTTGSSGSLVSRILSNVTVSPLIRLRSGLPFTLRTGADTNGDTHGFDRLFAIGRNTGKGPDFRSFDLRVTKEFAFAGNSPVRLLFSAEIENLFNRTNFASVNDVLGTDVMSPDYNLGTFNLHGFRDRHRTQPLSFTDAFPNRRFQFGFKFVF
jgi:uncharacterized repeat protein (TIGR01451 family)